MKIKLLVCFSLLVSVLSGQNKQDYYWIFNNDNVLDGMQAYVFDFTADSINIPLPLGQFSPITIIGLNASISDNEGNLLMYSNGCQVADRNHEIMPNGRNLNSDDYFQMLGDSCFSGYPGRLDIMILPDPGDEKGYYILHKPVMPDDSSRYRELRYTYVNLSLNNGNGDITEKNRVVSEDHRLAYSYLTAIRHANGKDWWILQAVDNGNKYLILLLTENGFSELVIQNIGPEFHKWLSASGSMTVSPDGKKLALFNAYDNLLLYDFDRSNGELSNPKQLIIKDTEEIVFSTLEFSPNSRFIYVATQDSLWQLDIEEENLEDGLDLIDVWNGIQDPFATTFDLMALAPNCKIYMCSGSSTNTYHVINEPNKKGKACDFVQQGIRLPFTSSLANMPNFPRFRVDDDEKCDPTITSVFGKEVFYRRDLNAYPNPVMDLLAIEIPENYSGQLFIYNMSGQLVWNERYSHKDRAQVDLSFLESGNYNLEFVPDKNSGRLIWTKQFVKL